MNSRAILMSAGGDPLLASFNIKLLKQRAWDKIDSLYVCYNNSTNTPPFAESKFLGDWVGDEKIKLIYWPTQLGYGLPITKMLQIATEDILLLLEDDGFILNGEAVDSCFKQIENGNFDLLGSPRFSCGTEIATAASRKYGLDYSGEGDKGPNFWPNFFFCKRADLLKTDLNFAPHGFDKGKHYDFIDHTMENDEAGDTFVWTSLWLRYLGLKIREIPQYHASPYEIEEFDQHKGKWSSSSLPNWIHGGSLSVGAGKYLANAIPDVSTDINKQEIETRVAFWTIISSTVEGYGEYTYTYQKGINDLVNNCNLDRDRIGRKIGIYRSLMHV